MEIVWDEIKRSLNLAKHKLDFTALTGEWFLVATVVPARWTSQSDRTLE